MIERNPRVSVHIVAWNGVTHLPTTLQAVHDQSLPSVATMVVDNGSVDGTIPWLAAEFPQVHVLRNTRNLGFCRAHNQAMLITTSPYVLSLNQDVALTPQWLERAVEILDRRPDIGAVGGKLLRFSYSDEELKRVVPSGIIDSAGLQIFRSRHVVDRGSGEQDVGQYDGASAVFGLSGACVLFRREALESIRFRDEFFDEDFFAYKDDVDVSLRLLRMGWVNWYDGSIVAYHHRTIQGQSSTKNLSIAKNYRRRQNHNAWYSYRNHWLVAMKHESWASIRRDLPWIFWYELRKFIFLLVTKPATLQGFFAAVRLRRAMKAKSVLLNRSAKVSAVSLRTWWTPQS